VLACEEHRVARPAIVGRDRDRRAVGEGGDQPADRLRADERLVGERHDGRDDAAVADRLQGVQPGR